MDQAETLRQMARGESVQTARAIAVTSGKGGVGKTSLSVNLAIALSRLGLEVGVLDGDLGLANIDIVLGLVPALTLSDVLYGGKRLDEILLAGPEGISVFAGGSGVYELANLSEWRLQNFIQEIAHLDRLLDVLIIDTGAGISRHVMSFLLASEEVIVMTTPELTSITDAYGVIKLVATKNPAASIRVVVNLAKNEAAALRVLASLRAVTSRFVKGDTAIELLGYLPPDPAVARAIVEQVPFVIGAPYAKASKAVNEIASRLVLGETPSRPPGVTSLFRRMARIIRAGAQG